MILVYFSASYWLHRMGYRNSSKVQLRYIQTRYVRTIKPLNAIPKRLRAIFVT